MSIDIDALEARVAALERSVGMGDAGMTDTRCRLERKLDAVVAVLKSMGATIESWLRN